MKIDMFAHICPPKFIDTLNKSGTVTWEMISRTSSRVGGPALWDLQKRFEVMDKYEDYTQVLTSSADVVEPFFCPDDVAYFSQLINDEMAEVVSKNPARFSGAVTRIPMTNIDAAMREIERTIDGMGFKGIQLNTPVYQYEKDRPLSLGNNFETMKAIDSPEFMPIYAEMSKRRLPIWIHPVGFGGTPVYTGEKRGRYQLAHILGWPIESAMAMSRIVCSGILAKYPNLRFVTHHCGSAIIPALADRLDIELEQYRNLGVIKWESGMDDPFLSKRPADYFKMFYADTALYGGTSALMCGYEYFGPDKIIFGTDYPYDMENGDLFIKTTIDAVNKMNISESDKKRIFEDNPKGLLDIAAKV
jgi:predicted TIM-barrel fold metal-dependent hydrolase